MRMLLRFGLFLCSVIAFTGCSDSIEIEGTYTTNAVWDLSAPFGRDGIGGAFADLLIEESVSTAVPGFIEDEAIDLTSALVRSPIKNAVESSLPSELKEDGEVLLGLRDLLGSIEVETELEFTDDVEGTERLSKLTFMHNGAPFVLDANRLPEGITVAGDIEGDRKERDLVELEPYNLEVRFGDFILILIDDVLLRNSSDLTTRAYGAIPCDTVVDAMTGGEGSWDFEVLGQSFSISASKLQSICTTIKDELGQYALGLARLDSGVQLEGKVTLIDENDDGVADKLSSDSAFKGHITLLPGPFEPEFNASFVATRR